MAVAPVAAFVVANVWYMTFSTQLATARGDSAEAGATAPAPWKIAAELVRTAILVTVIAWLIERMSITTWAGGLQLALVTWIGFPLMLWTGAMLWENTTWRLAAVHGGEWLCKLSVVAIILGAWQ